MNVNRSRRYGSLVVVCVVTSLIAGLAVRPAWAGQAADVIGLDGPWQVRLDPEDVGADQAWFDGPLGDASLRLPGSIQEQGLGNDVTVDTQWTGTIADRSWFTSPKYAEYRKPGNVKVPFWLQPKKHYVGPVWFQREVTVPESGSGTVTSRWNQTGPT